MKKTESKKTETKKTETKKAETKKPTAGTKRPFWDGRSRASTPGSVSYTHLRAHET